MSDFISALILFGLAWFILETLFLFLRGVYRWLYRDQIAAEESYRQFQAWQAAELERLSWPQEPQRGHGVVSDDDHPLWLAGEAQRNNARWN